MLRRSSSNESARSSDYSGLEEGNGKDKEAIKPDDVPFEEDTFGMAFCAMARDTRVLAHGFQWNRCARLTTTIFLLFFTIAVQISLLYNTKHYVSAKAVHDIREAYEEFENAIYICTLPNGSLNETACYVTEFGHLRGKAAARPDLDTKWKRMRTMSKEDQGEACRIPLSKLEFFSVILLIWSLTCLKDVRTTYYLARKFMKLPTVSSMKDSLFVEEEEDDEGDMIAGPATVVGLTIPVKLFMVLLLIVRAGITVYLLWLGCRWLLATNRFADLILNAIALEFILQLKDLVHATLVPRRNQQELSMTVIHNTTVKMRTGCIELLGTVSLLFVAMGWVAFYVIYFQSVLPGYNWDVHEVCEEYLKERYDVDPFVAPVNISANASANASTL